MSNRPPVSVVMPAHNCERFVAEATASILNQTFRDFEFIIVDDGSTDDTNKILGAYAALDSRIQLYRQENSGLVASLNRYCRVARGKYIARMDADDISLPTRLEKQFQFLERHSEIGILGTWIQDVDENGALGTSWPVPNDPAAIRWFLMFGSCMAHSSVMMRRDVLERVGFYRPHAIHIEDYDLWVRASAVSSLANLPEVLLKYRISRHSVSSRNLPFQEQHAADLKRSLLCDLVKHDVGLDAIEALRRSIEGVPMTDAAGIDDAARLLSELYRSYLRKLRLNHDEKTEIALDVFRRFWLLAVSARRISLRKSVGIWLRSFQFAPFLFSLRNLRKAISLSEWVVKNRGQIFVSQRRANRI